jgi:hypothetical protein
MLSLQKSSKEEEEIHDEQWLKIEIIVRVLTVFSEGKDNQNSRNIFLFQ